MAGFIKIFIFFFVLFDVLYFPKHSAGILVVSSAEANPLDTITQMGSQLKQMVTVSPAKLPKWFSHTVLRYYVLLHDNTDGNMSLWVTVLLSPHTVCVMLWYNAIGKQQSVYIAGVFENQSNQESFFNLTLDMVVTNFCSGGQILAVRVLGPSFQQVLKILYIFLNSVYQQFCMNMQ